ncbi:hypothetical protein FA09DRAFT_132682 [Tilletiopsis washingtonensis]|uniref:Uncharacterized protein n=1 Tax=Tilletiopsis washingtonensis TaxID=58919 RepID=A0A316Z3M9_9BASI|nr:hypothetical protein FA09DRAFT_132682 [Tilletiopsis washingtonensis]PWN95558.1 hypothetical protein FA09DRAFT_132682 [Tilletiopsis washingtonensis]
MEPACSRKGVPWMAVHPRRVRLRRHAPPRGAQMCCAACRRTRASKGATAQRHLLYAHTGTARTRSAPDLSGVRAEAVVEKVAVAAGVASHTRWALDRARCRPLYSASSVTARPLAGLAPEHSAAHAVPPSCFIAGNGNAAFCVRRPDLGADA